MAKKKSVESSRLREHLCANNGEPSAEDLKEIPELTDRELSMFR